MNAILAAGAFHLPGEIAVLFGTALAAAMLFRLLKTPTVVGFLFAGVLIGPYGLNVIAREQVEGLAEVGLVLLLFLVGLELSPRTFLQAGWRTAAVGVCQILLTMLVIGFTAWKLQGLPPVSSAVIAAAVTFSSTAIVLHILADRGETDSPTGNLLVAALVLQDIAVVAFMIVMPLMGGQPAGGPVIWTIVKPIAVLSAAGFGAWYVLPRGLTIVTRFGGRELLALFAVVAACAGAWLAGRVGWSPALGAFLAGLLLADSDVRHQLAAEVLPFRDVFNALFFVSMGMLLRVPLVREQWDILAIIVPGTLLLKAGLGWSSVRLLGWPVRVAANVGIGLASLSEFAVVVSLEGSRLGLLDDGSVGLINAVAVGTMVLGALWFASTPRLSAAVSKIAPRRKKDSVPPEAAAATSPPTGRTGLVGHVIVVGYGLNGHNLASVLRATRIPYCVVEMNHTLVRQARDDGCTHVIVGDAGRLFILNEAGLPTARALVVAINDVHATRRIVAQAAHARRDLYILARTRFVKEIDTLHRLGARTVIPEEFETSIEIFAQVLEEYGVDRAIVEGQIELVRAGRYSMLRGVVPSAAARMDVMRALEATGTRTFTIEPGSLADGKTIRELDLRAATGVTIIAVVRGGKPATSPPPDMQLQAGDVVVMVGVHAGLERARAMLRPPPPVDVA